MVESHGEGPGEGSARSVGAASVSAASIGPDEGALDSRKVWHRALAALCIAFAGLCALFWGTVSQMVSTWYVSATFNHGFLIAPICGWLIWERREAIAAYVPKPDFRGLLLIAFLGACWVVADAASVNFVKEFAFVGMIQATVFTVLGWRLVRAMLFPLGFLLFAVPFGEFLVPYLQDLTAVMVVAGLNWIGIPVFLDGIFLSIPSGNFLVAEACSGVRFLIATVALGALFANLSFRSLSRRLIIVLLSVAVPIVANGIRAFGIVWLAHISDHTIAVGVDHLIYGWIFFAIVTVLLLAIGMTFRETDGDNDIYMPAAWDRVAGRFSGTAGPAGAALAVLAAAALAPLYSNAMLDRGTPAQAHSLASPVIGGGWQETDEIDTAWRPRFVGADGELLRIYRKGDDEVHLYLAYYTHQRRGAELMSWTNSLFDDGAWTRASSGITEAQLEDRHLAVKSTRLLGRYGVGRVVWEWYWVGDRFTSDRYTAKLYEAAAKLFGTTQAAAAILVAADYHDSPAAAIRKLQDFVSNLEGFDELLGEAAAR